jgi:hypothetical protein
MLARITLRVAEGVELLKKDVLQAGLFLQFASGRLLQGFADLGKASGQCPLLLEWFLAR